MMDNTRKRKIVRNFVIGYLLLQVLVIVLILGFLGGTSGWLCCCRERTHVSPADVPGLPRGYYTL